jgi:OmpA-OmpF porin, OOP family
MKPIALLLLIPLLLAGCAETSPPPPTQAQAPLPQSFVLFFGFDSAKLTPEASDVVGGIAHAAEDAPAAKITIEGQASGRKPHDRELADRRAQAVAQALAAAGVDAARITVRGARAPTGESGVEAHKVVARLEEP